MKPRRDIIIDTARDLMAKFLYYERKEDDNLSVNSIEHAIVEKEISVEEILKVFEEIIRLSVEEYRGY